MAACAVAGEQRGERHRQADHRRVARIAVTETRVRARELRHNDEAAPEGRFARTTVRAPASGEGPRHPHYRSGVRMQRGPIRVLLALTLSDTVVRRGWPRSCP